MKKLAVKYSNCRGNCIANSLQYISKHKADIKAKKKKRLMDKKRKKKTWVEDASEIKNERTKKSPKPNTEIDLEDEK